MPLENIYVVSAGLKVPREDNPRRYIEETDPAKAVAVPASAYYLRRLLDGEIIKVDAPAPAKGGE